MGCEDKCKEIVVEECDADLCDERYPASCVDFLDCDGETTIEGQAWKDSLCPNTYTISNVCYDTVAGVGDIITIRVTTNFSLPNPNFVKLFAKYDTSGANLFHLVDSSVVETTTKNVAFDLKFRLDDIADVPTWDDGDVTKITLRLIDNHWNNSSEYVITGSSISAC